jgi:ribosomal protein S18 acetylase RimI-like enzyme
MTSRIRHICEKARVRRRLALMRTSNETLRCLERLHARAWPAAETMPVDGWLWRWSGGGSQRANSVSTIDFIGNDMVAALDFVESRYRARNSPSQLHTFDLTQPSDLPALLTARGYGAGETTLTMLAVAPMAGTPPAPAANVTITDDLTAEWLDVYLEAITTNRRAVNQQILGRVPDPRAFFSIRSGGRIISTALCVVNGPYAVAECVATREDARGCRGADLAMRSLMVWAASLGAHTVALQVVANNHSALTLYRRLGFFTVATNRFWVKRWS